MTIDVHVSDLLSAFHQRGNDRLSQIDKCASSQLAPNYRSDSIGDFTESNTFKEATKKRRKKYVLFLSIVIYLVDLKFWANAYEVINSLDARMDPFS